MTKAQVAVLRDMLKSATSRAKTSRIDGEALWLHSFIIQPLTHVLTRNRRTVGAVDVDGAENLMCVRAKIRK